MERESFSSPEVAALLNASFIPIKIDREERPDIDAIYMNYVQATTGSGGWPLNVFLTPDLEPVFGGTYWPGPKTTTTITTTTSTPTTPVARAGETTGFLAILRKMSEVWREQEDRCRSSAREITVQLKKFAEEGVHSQYSSGHHAGGGGGDDDEGSEEGAAAEAAAAGLEIELLEEAYQHFAHQYDPVHGGLGPAPKFPTPVKLAFLLRLGQWPSTAVQHVVGEDECRHATAMALHTLRQMARGGIRDQIGAGFARYSVTADWSLPHFEKMLFDQAQLLDVYLDAFLITRDPEMLGVVCDIATYLTSPPLLAPGGAFYAAEDADSLPTPADSEKREGAYYVWTLDEFRAVLGDRAADVCARFYGVTAAGNVARGHDPHHAFAGGRNVLRLRTASTPQAIAQAVGMAHEEVVTILTEGRRRLRQWRERERPRPALDDQVVVAWNGMAIGALARTSTVLEGVDAVKARECRVAAERAVAFVRREMFEEETGELWRTYREGRGDVRGFADDYAFLIRGLIELYEATFEEGYLRFADRLQGEFCCFGVLCFSQLCVFYGGVSSPLSIPPVPIHQSARPSRSAPTLSIR